MSTTPSFLPEYTWDDDFDDSDYIDAVRDVISDPTLFDALADHVLTTVPGLDDLTSLWLDALTYANPEKAAPLLLRIAQDRRRALSHREEAVASMSLLPPAFRYDVLAPMTYYRNEIPTVVRSAISCYWDNLVSHPLTDPALTREGKGIVQ